MTTKTTPKTTPSRFTFDENFHWCKLPWGEWAEVLSWDKDADDSACDVLSSDDGLVYRILPNGDGTYSVDPKSLDSDT